MRMIKSGSDPGVWGHTPPFGLINATTYQFSMKSSRNTRYFVNPGSTLGKVLGAGSILF